MENFIEIKKEIIKRAKESGSCKTQFERVLKSENISDLLMVVKDNFSYSCNNKIIDCELLSKIGQEICNQNDLFFNKSTNKGFLLADSATVEASGSATVRAWGSATVKAWDSAKVEAWGSDTVEARNKEKVECMS